METNKQNTKKSIDSCNKIYNIIKNYIEKNSCSPSVRDILELSELKSVSSVHSYIVRLEKQGLITRANNNQRSIILNNKDFSKPTFLPLIGNIAAGSPIIADQNITEYICVPSDLYATDRFMLKVHGNSMIDAGIFDNDYIVVKSTQIVNNGDIAVVIINDEATVKYYYKNDKEIVLKPANKKMQPLHITDCFVCGKVVGLYRYKI